MNLGGLLDGVSGVFVLSDAAGAGLSFSVGFGLFGDFSGSEELLDSEALSSLFPPLPSLSISLI